MIAASNDYDTTGNEFAQLTAHKSPHCSNHRPHMAVSHPLQIDECFSLNNELKLGLAGNIYRQRYTTDVLDFENGIFKSLQQLVDFRKLLQADSAVFEIKEGSFKALGVASHVRTKLHKISQAILIPTPIQTAAIPAISHYRRSDVLIQAPSGTGKTLAYVLPLLSMIDPTINQMQALIVVPSRELALQVNKTMKALVSGGSKTYRLNPCKVHMLREHSSSVLSRAMRRSPPHVGIVTPTFAAKLVGLEVLKPSDLRMLVLDEFGTLTSPLWVNFVKAVLGPPAKDGHARSPGRQVICVGSVMSKHVEPFLSEYLPNIERVSITAEATEESDKTLYAKRALPKHTKHYILHLFKEMPEDHLGKAMILRQIITALKPKGSVLAFVNKPPLVAEMAIDMKRHNFKAYCLKMQTPFKARDKILAQTKEAPDIYDYQYHRKPIQTGTPVLITTQPTAYGIHLDECSLVVNIDYPNDRMAYALRAGRVGRLRTLTPVLNTTDNQPTGSAKMELAEGTVVTVIPPAPERGGKHVLDRCLGWIRDLKLDAVHVKLKLGELVPIEASDFLVPLTEKVVPQNNAPTISKEDLDRLIATGIPPSPSPSSDEKVQYTTECVPPPEGQGIEATNTVLAQDVK